MIRSKLAASLGEILIGAVILVMAFLALLAVFPTAHSAADQSGYVVLASQLGQATMEREMVKNFDQLASLPVVTETVQGTSLGAPTTRQFSVSVTVNKPTADRARITVSVQWKLHSQDVPKMVRLESTRVRP